MYSWVPVLPLFCGEKPDGKHFGKVKTDYKHRDKKPEGEAGI